MKIILIVVFSVCIGLSSQNYCKDVFPLKYPHDIATSTFSSALVIDNITDIENYKCESGSYITAITYNETITKPFSCYGYAGFKNNVTFNGHKGDVKVPLWSPEHQGIYSTNNGNFEYMECGVLSGGPCDGDIIWDTGLWMATDQSGCGSPTGLKSLKALYAGFEIIGKCASKCTAVNIDFKFIKPVNNHGLVD